jgi:hypothetical protein
VLADAGSQSIQGRFAGFELRADTDPLTGTSTIALTPSPVRVEIDIAELAELDASRLIQRIEHRLARLERDLDDATTGRETAEAEAERAAARLDQPFEHADRLNKLLARQTELERLLAPEPPEPPTVAERLATVRCDPPGRGR